MHSENKHCRRLQPSTVVTCSQKSLGQIPGLYPSPTTDCYTPQTAEAMSFCLSYKNLSDFNEWAESLLTVFSPRHLSFCQRSPSLPSPPLLRTSDSKCEARCRLICTVRQITISGAQRPSVHLICQSRVRAVKPLPSPRQRRGNVREMDERREKLCLLR